MKFYKIPFIWLIIPFCIGITSANLNILSPTYSIIVTAIFLCFLLFVLTRKKTTFNQLTQQILLAAVLMLLGNCLMTLDGQKATSVSNKDHHARKYIGVIEEVSTTKSGYIKYIVRCTNNSDSSNTPKSEKKLVFVKLNQHNIPKNENSILIFHCKFNKIENIGYPGEFDSKYYWKNKGIDEIGFISNHDNLQYVRQAQSTLLSPEKFRNHLTTVLNSVLTGQELALANALILGERSLLTNETTQAFGDTGAMHILAVSGLHIGILLQILMRIFQLFQKWITKNQATILSLILVWLYALITGFSPSVIRSVIMFSMLLIGSMKGKVNSELNILAFSAFIILSWKPVFLYDVGFQLSYTAMVGIYLFYPFLKNVLISRFKIIQMIIEGSMVGIAAQITTVPLTLYYFHQFPNYFIVTNIALMTFSFIILLIGILLFCLYWIPIVKFILGVVLQKTMTCMLAIVHFFSTLPFATANGFSYSKWIILLIYLIISLFCISLYLKKSRLLYSTLVVGTCVTSYIFLKRLDNNNANLYYSHASYPSFQIQKINQKNYFIFPTYTWKSNKIKRIIKDFTTLHPGKPILVPLEKLKPIKLN